MSITDIASIPEAHEVWYEACNSMLIAKPTT